MIDLTGMPKSMGRLPRDERGYPIPFFTFIDPETGIPNFTTIAPGKIRDCVRFRKCWICGEKMGRFMSFVIGPASSITHVSGEPPSHRECARFACRVCPFLANPNMKRIPDKYLPEATPLPGDHLDRNPGVMLIWTTKNYQVMPQGEGVLFVIGKHEEIEYYSQSRKATRNEIIQSINGCLPFVRAIAEQQGPKAVIQLANDIKYAFQLVPEDPPS